MAATRVALVILGTFAVVHVQLLSYGEICSCAKVISPLCGIDKWMRRKLRCYIWTQWGRSGYRELRKRGAHMREA